MEQVTKVRKYLKREQWKSVSDTKHTVVNLSQSIDILSLYHKGGISNEYKVYR